MKNLSLKTSMRSSLAGYGLTLFLLFLALTSLGRGISLTKIGGNGQLYLPAGMPANGTPVPVNTLVYDENANGLGTVSNWTDYFNYFSKCINGDAENGLTAVSYKIEIDATGTAANPYVIGKQDLSSGVVFAASDPVLYFAGGTNSIHKVTVSGLQGKAFFKYADSLYYGSWAAPGYTMPATGCGPAFTNTTAAPVPVPPAYICNYNYLTQANIGNFITAVKTDNLTVEDIAVDGNSTAVRLGGNWGDVGRQLVHSGINLFDCRGSVVTQCDFHHFCLDGISLNGACDGILLEHSHFEYNGRQGCSWVGGKNVTAAYCSFSHTGRGLITSSPGAGLDIEPESGLCQKGVFKHCDFTDNAGCALVQDSSPEAAEDMQFDSCTFHDVDGYSVWVKGRRFTFTNSRIWGGFVHGNSGLNPGDETRFYHCDFADEAINGQSSWQALAHSDGIARRLTFSDCTFRRLNHASMIVYLRPSSTTEADRIVLSNCSIVNSSAMPPAIPSALLACVFDGKNSILSTASNYYHIINANGLVFTGSSTPCNRNKFQLGGHLLMNYSTQNTPALPEFIMGRDTIGGTTQNGYFDFEVDDGSFLRLIPAYPLVGSNSRLINKSGGQLYANPHIENYGKVLFEEGSYTMFEYNFTYLNGVGAFAEFYRHPGATNGSHPYWSAQIAASGLNNGWMQVSGTCAVYGSDAWPVSLSGSATFTPGYSQLKSGEAFSIAYAVTDPVNCNTPGNGSLGIKPIGTNANYSVDIGGSLYLGAAGQPVAINGLTEGTYTVSVTDISNGCTESLIITLATIRPQVTVDLSTNPYTVTVSGSGGTAPYKYSTGNQLFWSSNGVFGLPPGNHTVFVKDANGCIGQETVDLPWPKPAGIAESGSPSRFIVYPNPVSGGALQLTYTGADLARAFISISDLSGRIVLAREEEAIASGKAMQLDVSALAPGLYCLSVRDKGGVVLPPQKFVITQH